MSLSWLILIELMLSFIEVVLRSGFFLFIGCLYFLYMNRELLEKSERVLYLFMRDGLKFFWWVVVIIKKIVLFLMFVC